MKDDRLNLYKSLFKGREDVFALRWEKSGKSSYMPAYSFDPHRYRLESSGVYYEEAALFFHKGGYDVAVVLPNKAKKYLQALGFKTKNDQVEFNFCQKLILIIIPQLTVRLKLRAVITRWLT